MRTPAALACLLGGICWLGAFVVDRASGGGLVDALTWAGVVLLMSCAVVAGAGLVSRSAPALRGLVGICFAALIASVLQVLRQGGDPVAIDAAFGVVAAVVGVVVLARTPRHKPDSEPASHRLTHRGRDRERGAHAR